MPRGSLVRSCRPDSSAPTTIRPSRAFNLLEQMLDLPAPWAVWKASTVFGYTGLKHMEYPEHKIIHRQVPRFRSVSRVFVLGVAAVALLLGFALGIFSTSSTGDGVVGSRALYDEDLVTSLFEDASPAVVEVDVTQGAGIRQRTGVRLRVPDRRQRPHRDE